MGSAPNRLPRWATQWATQWRTCGLNLLFPPRCVCCDAEMPGVEDDVLLCRACRGELALEDWAYRLRCGAPASPDGPAPKSCPMCETARLRFDAVVSLGAYRSELGRAVLRMKRPDGELLCRAMGRLYCLLRGSDVADFRADVVVPVPMFWTRRLVRGTNSPDILAECLSRHLRVPLVQGMVVRRRKTEPQSTLKPRERFRNVRGAFRVRAGYDLSSVRVVLVDDILTTGATSSEVAGVLKRAGASMVAVAVLARGVGDKPS